jgi:hypothetical protein
MQAIAERLQPIRHALGTRTLVMGVLNTTPDSFYDGGRYASLNAALARAEQMLAEGADILDIGGESTRPGAEPVPEDEELRRTIPLIEALAARYPNAILSIDTTKSRVAELALQAANRLVNLQPHDAHYRLRRARLLDNLGRRGEAVRDYEWLAFEAHAPRGITVWATLELQRLDRLQIRQLMRLLMEDALFWVKFIRDPKDAARERGFIFSRVGEEVLEALPDTLLRELPRPLRHNAGYS